MISPARVIGWSLAALAGSAAVLAVLAAMVLALFAVGLVEVVTRALVHG